MNANTLRVGDRILSPGLGSWNDSTIVAIVNQYLVCRATTHNSGGQFRVHASDCLPLNHWEQWCGNLSEALSEVINAPQNDALISDAKDTLEQFNQACKTGTTDKQPGYMEDPRSIGCVDRTPYVL